MGVTAQGYSYTDLPTKLAALRQKLLPPGLTFAPGTPESELTYRLAEAIDDQALEVRDLAALLAPSQRVGIWLDDAAAMVGIARGTGTRSSVVLTVTGAPSTFVLAGAIVVTNADGIAFTSQNDVTLSLGGAGFVTAFLHAALPTHWLPFTLVGRAQGWRASPCLCPAGSTAPQRKNPRRPRP